MLKSKGHIPGIVVLYCVFILHSFDHHLTTTVQTHRKNTEKARCDNHQQAFFLLWTQLCRTNKIHASTLVCTGLS